MMRKFIFLTLILLISCMAVAQTKIDLTIGNKTMTATLADNEATRELVSMLSGGPVTINMDDYGGFEKVGALPKSLPISNSQVATVPGDIMLYQGTNMVIFYGSNSWSYTRLGKIDGATVENLREFLGRGSVVLEVSLNSAAGVDEIKAEGLSRKTVYDLKGNPVSRRPLPPGIYIIDGKKTFVR